AGMAGGLDFFFSSGSAIPNPSNTRTLSGGPLFSLRLLAPVRSIRYPGNMKQKAEVISELRSMLADVFAAKEKGEAYGRLARAGGGRADRLAHAERARIRVVYSDHIAVGVDGRVVADQVLAVGERLAVDLAAVVDDLRLAGLAVGVFDVAERLVDAVDVADVPL